MTLASVVRTRLAIWRQACDAWGLEINPPFTRVELEWMRPGLVSFWAFGRPVGARDEQAVTLSVVESWEPGPDPHGDRRVEAEGCHLAVLNWHLQVESVSGAPGAERLDVVPEPDGSHPRVHRHPYGSPNDVRQPSDLPPPGAWLYSVDQTLSGLLSAGLATYLDEQD